jgi:glycosyltransferase A (GT-A) superfamily protein (DUF2064 family)
MIESGGAVQIVVVAKEPRPGRVKTRLCPPCTPRQASGLAGAALADTVDAVSATAAARRVLLLDGAYEPPAGWSVVAQQGDGLADRLANGFVDTAYGTTSTLLIGMDTPQVTTALLDEVAGGLSDADAVLGPALDGGWWALALRVPAWGRLLAGVPMSRPETGQLTLRALREAGLTVSLGPPLRDVDTAADLPPVAAECGDTRFARAVRGLGLS